MQWLVKKKSVCNGEVSLWIAVTESAIIHSREECKKSRHKKDQVSVTILIVYSANITDLIRRLRVLSYTSVINVISQAFV